MYEREIDLALRVAGHVRAGRQPGADRDIGVARDERRHEREQRVEVGREVDVHVRDDVGVTRTPRGSAARSRGPCDRGGGRGRAGSSRSRSSARARCRSVDALSTIVIRHENGKSAAQIRVEATDARTERPLLVVDRDHDVEYTSARRACEHLGRAGSRQVGHGVERL